MTRWAAEDAFPTEVAEALALVESCSQCAILAADIRAIRSLTATLPAPARPRDFRLSVEDAERLRGSGWQRLLRRLASPGLAPLRPVAGAAMSLGLALAVVGAALPTPVSVADENAAEFNIQAAPDAGEAPVAVPPDVAQPGGEPASGEGIDTGSNRDGEPEQMAAGGEDASLEAEAGAAEPPMRDLLIYAGLVITLLSLAVLAVVSVARRRWMDPLLR